MVLFIIVFQFLKGAAENTAEYDIAFADPPFRLWSGDFGECLLASIYPLITSDAILLVRCPKAVVASLPVEKYEVWKTSIFGESRLFYLKKK